MSKLRVKRAHCAARRSDGQRVLVDRLWPRGLAKDRLRIDAGANELAPSDELRAWFHHDLGKWDEFRMRCAAELNEKSELVEELRERLDKGPVTLVSGAKDEKHNNAVALKVYLDRLERRR